MEQHREHLLAAETKRLQADLEFQLQDALLVCDVLTPVLRQMTREASKVCTDNQSVIMSSHDSDADENPWQPSIQTPSRSIFWTSYRIRSLHFTFYRCVACEDATHP